MYRQRLQATIYRTRFGGHLHEFFSRRNQAKCFARYHQNLIENPENYFKHLMPSVELLVSAYTGDYLASMSLALNYKLFKLTRLLSRGGSYRVLLGDWSCKYAGIDVYTYVASLLYNPYNYTISVKKLIYAVDLLKSSQIIWYYTGAQTTVKTLLKVGSMLD
uniref:Uncharacterized protein n=1 Tax=Nyctotherus ovalis TaxID=70075 RepID=Q5DUX8_NYCOV|nr:hypothetical protein [Nyctotherus ovalis]